MAVTWPGIRRCRVVWPAGVPCAGGRPEPVRFREAQPRCRRYGSRSPQISRSVASAERPAAGVSGVAGGDRHRIAIWLPWREAQPRQAARPAVPPIADRRAGARCASGRGDAREGPRGGRDGQRVATRWATRWRAVANRRENNFGPIRGGSQRRRAWRAPRRRWRAAEVFFGRF